MKLKDITIKNIYDYLKSHSDFKIELSEEKDVSNIIDLYIYDMTSKLDIFVCSIYKNKEKDFMIKTSSFITSFKKFESGVLDINNVELEEVVCALLNLTRTCIYQNIEDEKLIIDCVDNFYMSNEFELASIVTLNNKVIESQV